MLPIRDKQQLKIELLSQWKLEAEFRKNCQRWVRVSWSECPDPNVLIRVSWSEGLVRETWPKWKGGDWKLSRGSVSLPLVNGAAMGGESGCFTWTDCQMVADNKQQVLNFTIWDIFTIWEKYILQFETNTLCNLRQIHFTVWDNYIWQFETNTFYNLREIHLAICTGLSNGRQQVLRQAAKLDPSSNRDQRPLSRSEISR